MATNFRNLSALSQESRNDFYFAAKVWLVLASPGVTTRCSGKSLRATPKISSIGCPHSGFISDMARYRNSSKVRSQYVVDVLVTAPHPHPVQHRGYQLFAEPAQQTESVGPEMHPALFQTAQLS